MVQHMGRQSGSYRRWMVQHMGRQSRSYRRWVVQHMGRQSGSYRRWMVQHMGSRFIERLGKNEWRCSCYRNVSSLTERVEQSLCSAGGHAERCL